ncbi:hypothetical protein PUN28_020166 [Cardiocondyla obscurior]|uniref:G2/M phase-specific E3 ubiquitin-protein ligase n=1 Tax=Cardiocondyla obscurior TaxID=286306 RepID=A0AAW2EB40_9HYME
MHDDALVRMSPKGNSSISKVCCFCNSAEDNELEYGKIYEHNGIVTHYYCMLLSSNMEQKGDDDEGILGFLAEDIQKELRRGKRLVCSYCRKAGATLGCCNVRCKRIFHLPCGLRANSLHQFFGEFRSYCINHRPKQNIDEQILKQICTGKSVLCYICYDKVNINDLVKTLWAPCCKKDAWFHRTCIQQLALSAGYFFKCPLCNNKKDFQKTMLEYGIYVPSQDASWELVPNAFEELLYRHDQCDAPKCFCPKGRKYTSHNAKWELTLCRTCGSQGIHKACGQLKWANPVWDCSECISILSNNDLRPNNIRLDNSIKDSQTKDFDARSPNSHSELKSDSNLDSGSDTDSDLDSDSIVDTDTDISVGTDFPVQLANNSLSSTSLNSALNKKLRPGPRCFKLQQEKLRLNYTNTERNITAKASLESINTSMLNNNESNEKKEPSTSKENTLQQKNKEDISQKKQQISDKSNAHFQPIQKETDVITIDSDDDEIELIARKRRTGVVFVRTQQPVQSCVPTPVLNQISKSSLNATTTSAISDSQNIANDLSAQRVIIDLLDDNVSVSKSNLSEFETLNKSIPISDKSPIGVITSQNTTLDLGASSSDDLEGNTIDTSETSIMNIKITSVTSVPPEVFENVPDVCNDVTLPTNITDPMSLSKVLQQLVTQTAHFKRSMNEASDFTENRKKIKTSDSNEMLHATNPAAVSVIVAHSTNKQQNENITISKPDKIDQLNKGLSRCTFGTTSNVLNPLNNQTTNLYEVHKTDNMRNAHEIVSHSEENNMFVNVQQNKDNPIAQQTQKYKDYNESNRVYLQIKNPPVNGFYLQKIPNPNFTINELNTHAVKTEETKVYALSSNSILPPVTNNVTACNVDRFNAPNMSDDKVVAVNRQEAVTKKDLCINTPSVGNNSSDQSYCDGDAGTKPVGLFSVDFTDDPSDCHKNGAHNEEVNSVIQSVFPQVTNNHNTCHQPRLIPQYMNLQDLKFQVCDLNNIQMILYDTFSVNIPMKNPRENNNRWPRVDACQKSKKSFILASREVPCSSDYMENLSIDRQRSDKFSRSSKNGNCSVNDKSTCTKYVVHGQDDIKENLDPIRSKMLSRNNIVENINPINDDVITSDHFCNENDNEIVTCLVTSDTNLRVLNQTVYDENVDNVNLKDSVTTPDSYDQGSQENLKNLQDDQASICDATPMLTEKKSEVQPVSKETSKLMHNIDFDFNVNKNIEKVSQNNITVSMSQHDKTGNDHTDDFSVSNDYKSLDDTNVIRPKNNNQNIPCVSNITKLNEHNTLNKQIYTRNSKKLIQYAAFQGNAVCYNETRMNNNAFCFKVSIDLSKIQSLIDSKPELFKNRQHKTCS